MVKGWHVSTARCDTGAIALLEQGDPPYLTPNACPSTCTGPRSTDRLERQPSRCQPVRESDRNPAALTVTPPSIPKVDPRSAPLNSLPAGYVRPVLAWRWCCSVRLLVMVTASDLPGFLAQALVEEGIPRPSCGCGGVAVGTVTCFFTYIEVRRSGSLWCPAFGILVFDERLAHGGTHKVRARTSLRHSQVLRS